MSELRKFLRYEIHGLLIIIYTFSLSLCFVKLPINTFSIDYLGPLAALAAASALFALVFGWFAYQMYIICADISHKNPHYTKKAFCYIKERLKNMKDECCFALVDYILVDDMYTTYPGLADTIRGFWDNYESRIVAGIYVPIISSLLSLAFYLLIKTNRIIIDPSLIDLNMSMVLLVIIIIIVIYLIVISHNDRVKREVETIEFYLITTNKNQRKLEEFIEKYKNNSYYQEECMDP